MSETHYTIPVQDLYLPQDLSNLLWHKCVTKRRTLANVARLDYHNDLDAMVKEGLNANFMTRARWFDPPTISELLRDTCGLVFLVEKLGVDAKQFEELQLTHKEYDLLSITCEDVKEYYGDELAQREVKRMGHKTNQSYFLFNFGATETDSSSAEDEYNYFESGQESPQQEHSIDQWTL